MEMKHFLGNLDNLPSVKSYCFLSELSLSEKINMNELTELEIDRIKRLKKKEDRDRFLLSRVMARKILGSFLCLPQSNVNIINEFGQKPTVENSKWKFNISHSGNWVALAVSYEADVGIDVESHTSLQTEFPVEMVFHGEDKFPNGTDDIASFYTAWTLKEAIAKCDGRGLSLPFNELRLEHMSEGKYCGHYQNNTWHAQHSRLSDGAHLAYAGNVPTDPMYVTLQDI